MSKTFFVSVSDGSVSRNIIRTDFLPTLLTHDSRVVLVCPEEKRAYYQAQFGSEKVEVVSFAPRKPSFLERVLDFCTYNAFHTDTLELMQWRAYEEGRSHIHPYLKKVFGVVFGRYWFRAFIRWCDMLIPVSSELETLFETYAPDMIFSTMVLDRDIDIPLIRCAKRRGVRTGGMVRSWDNLTTYGFLRQIPEFFFAQNIFLRDRAVDMHDVPPKTISVVGVPHYDAHTHSEHILSRDVFCQKLGLDPDKKIFLYGAVGDFLFPHEATLVPLFEKVLSDGTIHPASQLIFRPHPAHASVAEKYTNLTSVVIDRGVTYLTPQNYGSFEMSEAEYIHFLNVLYHADAVITASGTSILIDAATYDKPLISVAFDGDVAAPYWFSIKRFLDHATHSKALVATGGVTIVDSQEMLIEAMNSALKEDSQTLHEGRKKILAEFVAPFDGHSGERLARTIYEKSL